MAFSREHLFSKRHQLIARFSKLLSHPARLTIIMFLLSSGTATHEQISELVPLSPAGISHHINQLRRAGLLLYKEENPRIYYELDLEQFDAMYKPWNEFLEKLK